MQNITCIQVWHHTQENDRENSMPEIYKWPIIMQYTSTSCWTLMAQRKAKEMFTNGHVPIILEKKKKRYTKDCRVHNSECQNVMHSILHTSNASLKLSLESTTADKARMV